MLGLSSSIRTFLSTQPCDMRKGLDGLCALVTREFGESVYSGALFAFLSKRRDRAKVLWFSHGGFVVYYKRLERGRFRRPSPGPDGRVHLTLGELQALLDGIDLSNAPRAKLWIPEIPRKSGSSDIFVGTDRISCLHQWVFLGEVGRARRVPAWRGQSARRASGSRRPGG